MHLLPYLFIYFYTLPTYKFPHAATNPSTTPQTQNPDPEIPFRISEPGFLLPIYQLIFPKLGFPLFIQRLVFRVLTLVLRHDLLHLAHYLHIVETQGNA